MIKLVANQIYDKMTKLFNNVRQRLGIKGSGHIEEPIRDYDSFNLENNGILIFTYKNKVTNFENINEHLMAALRTRELGVNRLRLKGFGNITDKDIHPYRSRYKDAREKVRKLNDNLNERSKAIES